MNYDLVVIGAGPAGSSAALQGAKLGLRVAVIESSPMLGGACVHTGTLPSKSLRHTIQQLVSMRKLAQIGVHSTQLRRLTIQDLMGPKSTVVQAHQQTIRSFFERNHVDVLPGSASFISPTKVRVSTRDHDDAIEADHVVIATGSSPRRPESIPFDDHVICDSDSILELNRIPRSMVIVGAGVIGCEYACMFAALGVKVSLLDRRKDLMRFLDHDIRAALIYSMGRMGIRLMLGESLKSIKIDPTGDLSHAEIALESGRKLRAQRALVAAGRTSNTASLDLAQIGVPVDQTGLIKVDEFYQTVAEGVYAAGDVIGFPALASTSMHQGRMAVLHAAGQTLPKTLDLPLAIYTMPEISAVGLTEEQCREKEIPYEVGYSRYAETPRGQILGDTDGMLKLIFRRDDRTVIGVHLIGQGSSELVHIGMLLVHSGGKLDQLV